MRNIKSLLWLLLVVMSCKLSSQEIQRYIPFRKGNLWGLCDAGRFVIIQPQYNSISRYDNAAGGFHALRNGKFGIVDHNAALVMPFISEEPIFVNDGFYVVFDGFDYYNYSMQTKMRIGPYVPPESFEVRDRWEGSSSANDRPGGKVLTWNDLDDVDLQMLKPYEDEELYTVNFTATFLEILSKDSHIGIYIPAIKKLYQSTPEIAYVGWQFYNKKPYILTTGPSNLYGMADEFSNEIYPMKYTSISLLDKDRLIVLSEPDPANDNQEIFKTVLPNSRVLNGHYQPAGTVLKDGHEFSIYETVINGEKNYAGEDGTLYFED